jgi:hypothetical protein
MRFGPHRMRRDIGNIQSALVGSGRAAWLEPAMIPSAAAVLKVSDAAIPAARGTADDELRRAAQAVRQLLL